MDSDAINGARRLWLLDNQASITKNKEFSDLVRNLNLKEDESGLLRSFSGLKNAKIPFDAKAPVFINRNHKLAKLIVCYAHLKVLRRGIKQTLTEMRSMHWISRGRSFVEKLLHPCTVCKKLNSRPYAYPSQSDLPDICFGDEYPFIATGRLFRTPVLFSSLW